MERDAFIQILTNIIQNPERGSDEHGPQDPADFDLEAIADEVREMAGRDGAGNLDPREIWPIIDRNRRS